MGLIVYDQAKGGWIDAASKERVDDHRFKERYEEAILSHAGIRFVCVWVCFVCVYVSVCVCVYVYVSRLVCVLIYVCVCVLHMYILVYV